MNCDSPQSSSDTGRPSWLLASQVLLGIAIHIRDGFYQPWAFVFLTLSLVALLAWTLKAPGIRGLGPLAVRFAPVLLAGQLLLMGLRPLGLYEPSTAITTHAGFWVTFAAFALLVLIAGTTARNMPRLLPWAIVVVFVAMGALVLRWTWQPHIDVYTVQRDGSEALLQQVMPSRPDSGDYRPGEKSQSPYAIHSANIYYPQTQVYGPELVDASGKWLTFGYCYMPATLYLTAAAHWLVEDVRWAHVLAMAAVVAIAFSLAQTPRQRVVALLLVAMPRMIFVYEQSWTDTFVLAALALCLWVSVRSPGLLFAAFGLLLASKQYTLFMVPLGLLLLPRQTPWRKIAGFYLSAGLVAAAVSLPLILWDVEAFMKGAVWLQFGAPFRPDALSYLSLLSGQRPWGAGASALGFAIAALAGALALRQWGNGNARNRASLFAGAVALVYFVFFAFNKQAFCNYYYFVCGAAALAGVVADDNAPGDYNHAIS